VFKVKRDDDGQIAQYKARLMAMGFIQKHSVDYHETFAPAAKVICIRTLLALVAHNDWEVEQLDVVTSFLQATILCENLPAMSPLTLVTIKRVFVDVTYTKLSTKF
jgi:hypothetical protein